MKPVFILASFLIAACQRSPEPTSREAPPKRSSSSLPEVPSAWTPPGSSRGIVGFDTDRVDFPPTRMSFTKTGRGRAGRWVVRADVTAPSAPNVLAQTDTDDTDYRFPIAVLAEPTAANVRVRVRCKPVSGRVDRACGIVVRYKDESNYYVTRANALEGNIRFYVVERGKRKQLASFEGRVTANAWHDFRIEARGDRFTVACWDGKQVLDQKDATFPATGRVGLWTKADSVTYFDDLEVEAL
jgi:3-keto-disaccharide hydrolase